MWLEENKEAITAKKALYWLEDHADTLDWKALDEWADENEGEEGYEWIEETREMWQEELDQESDMIKT